MSDTQIAHIPDLELADYIFTLRQSGLADHHDEARRTLFTQIKNDHMAPLLQFVRDLLPDEYSDALYSELAQKNTEKLAELDEKIKDSEENLGEVELGQAAIAKAEYLAKICDKDKAITAYEDAFTKTSSLGARIDIVFSIIRLCLFFGDNELIKTNIARAQTLIDEGGDWDRRNRLKAHNGIYLLSIRQFEQSADQLLQVLATFTSLELTSYNQIACYAALAGAVALPRVDVKEKIIESPEVIEVLPSEDKYADVFAMITSLHTRDYAVFFTSLADVEEHHFRCNRYLAQHARWYVREMRRRAYAQILQSYRSLSLARMAEAFGVTSEWLDKDLSQFIPNKQLNCVINRVDGIVETNRPDSKNAQYQNLIKSGDLLLNKLQRYQAAIRLTSGSGSVD